MTTQEQQPAQPAHPPASRPATLAASAELVPQYYHRVNECPTINASSAECICWHDKGTGPHPDARVGDIYNGVTLTWRHRSNGPIGVNVPAAPPAADERAPVADERAAFKKCHAAIIKAISSIARADGPDARKEDDPELIYRSPVMAEVARIRGALDECSAALASDPVAAPSDETLRLAGVIADKIEDGTLFQAGIFSRRELADKVRAVVRFVGAASAPVAGEAQPVIHQHGFAADNQRLRAINESLDKQLEEVMTERDEYHDVADKLADAIADHLLVEIGEHSSSNCPWMRALEAIKSAAPQASPAADGRDALPPLDENLTLILGRPNFACAQLAQMLRANGQTIKHRAEDEQAAVIYFLLSAYLKHGAGWADNASEALAAIAASRAKATKHALCNVAD